MTGGEVVPVRVSIVDVVVLRFTTRGAETLLMRRAVGARCTGAWETVHGKIEPGETPDAAALREVHEETGLVVERLYNITLGGFYLHKQGVLSLTVVFCAIVAADDAPVQTGEEHDAVEWMPLAQAMEQCAWPREREAMQHVQHLFRNGRDGGAVEDVLRVL